MDVKRDNKSSSILSWKFAFLVLGVLQSFFSCGLIFGWSGLVLILKGDRTYAYICGDEFFQPDGSQLPDVRADNFLCGGEEEHLNQIVAVTLAAQLFCTLPAGVLIDRGGPKMTFIMQLCIFVGSLFCAFAKPYRGQPVDLFFTGTLMMNIFSVAITPSFYHYAKLFPVYFNVLCAVISASVGISSIVFPIFHEIWKGHIATRQELFIGLAIIICLFLPFDLLQPNRKLMDNEDIRFSLKKFGVYIVSTDENSDGGQEACLEEGREGSLKAGEDVDKAAEEILKEETSRNIWDVSSKYKDFLYTSENNEEKQFAHSSPEDKKCENTSLDSVYTTANFTDSSQNKDYVMKDITEDANDNNRYIAATKGEDTSEARKSSNLNKEEDILPVVNTNNVANKKSRNYTGRFRGAFIRFLRYAFHPHYLLLMFHVTIWEYMFMFYLSSANSQLIYMTENEKEANYYTNIFGWIVPVGIAGSVGCALLMDRFNVNIGWMSQALVGLIFVGCQMIPIVQLQIVTFICYTLSQEAMFSVFFTILNRVIPENFFCTLSGFILTFQGCIALSINPVNAKVLSLGYNYYQVHITFLTLGIVSFFWIWLVRWSRVTFTWPINSETSYFSSCFKRKI